MPGCWDASRADIVSRLIEQKHLIEDGTDELDIVRARKLAGVMDANRLDVVLMPTLDCNFACEYCYENRCRPACRRSPKLPWGGARGGDAAPQSDPA